MVEEKKSQNYFISAVKGAPLGPLYMSRHLLLILETVQL